jgi:hydroxyacylglutathione hydrolase
VILRRFYDDKLAQASYLVGCAATGDALIVDPNRDAEQYVEAAAMEKLRITHVTETHIHADFLSGLRELAARTGARPYLSDEGDADWKYAFATADDAVLLHDGDAFMVGNIRIQVLHTPGHTPEHVCFVVTDTAGADRPMGIFTGDFVFMGDVGRPDLLEKAAGIQRTMAAAARQLFASIQKFKAFPDYLQIWPGHGAGSACGKSLGAVPQSTLGYEKLFNWAFAREDEEEFVRAVLAGQPEPPKYFAQMKRINKEGPPLLGGFQRPPRLGAELLQELLPDALVVDARSGPEHARARIPGTINVPLNRSFNTWAGWLIPYDREFYLLLDDGACPTCIDEAVRDLALIGHDRLAGWFGADAVAAWRSSGRELERIDETTAAELNDRMRAGGVAVLDVRGRGEWEAGHLPGVSNIPLGYLIDRLGEVPSDRPLVLHCQTGNRSRIAASLLRLHGYRDVANLTGGFAAWRDEGHPVEAAEPVHAG